MTVAVGRRQHACLLCLSTAPQPGTGLRRNLVKNSQLETPEPKTPEPETAQPKAPEPKAPETENTTSSTTPTPPVAKQEGPTVTGSYTKAVIWEGNRFDPSIAAVPSGFGNEQSDLKEVAILDSWTEFATDFGSGAIEKLDISTNGLITLDVSYPTNTMYEEGAYTLGSAWFTKYKAAKLVSSNGLPTDVSVTVSGASDLAAGVLKINIPTFNLLEGTVGFQLQFRLVSGCASLARLILSKASRVNIPATSLLINSYACARDWRVCVFVAAIHSRQLNSTRNQAACCQFAHDHDYANL